MGTWFIFLFLIISILLYFVGDNPDTIYFCFVLASLLWISEQLNDIEKRLKK